MNLNVNYTSIIYSTNTCMMFLYFYLTFFAIIITIVSVINIFYQLIRVIYFAKPHENKNHLYTKYSNFPNFSHFNINNCLQYNICVHIKYFDNEILVNFDGSLDFVNLNIWCEF